jgi:hypothetical protein
MNHKIHQGIRQIKTILFNSIGGRMEFPLLILHINVAKKNIFETLKNNIAIMNTEYLRRTITIQQKKSLSKSMIIDFFLS